MIALLEMTINDLSYEILNGVYWSILYYEVEQLAHSSHCRVFHTDLAALIQLLIWSFH